jgi:hypothetical protein
VGVVWRLAQQRLGVADFWSAVASEARPHFRFELLGSVSTLRSAGELHKFYLWLGDKRTRLNDVDLTSDVNPLNVLIPAPKDAFDALRGLY